MGYISLEPEVVEIPSNVKFIQNLGPAPLWINDEPTVSKDHGVRINVGEWISWDDTGGATYYMYTLGNGGETQLFTLPGGGTRIGS
jgi:hypothetical protein